MWIIHETSPEKIEKVCEAVSARMRELNDKIWALIHQGKTLEEAINEVCKVE